MNGLPIGLFARGHSFGERVFLTSHYIAAALQYVAGSIAQL